MASGDYNDGSGDRYLKYAENKKKDPLARMWKIKKLEDMYAFQRDRQKKINRLLPKLRDREREAAKMAVEAEIVRMEYNKFVLQFNAMMKKIHEEEEKTGTHRKSRLDFTEGFEDKQILHLSKELERIEESTYIKGEKK